MKKTIKIKCKGADLLPFESLKIFQGNLKKLTKQNLNKLKNLILQKGFCAPFFVWQDSDNNWILDGSQRDRALKLLQDDGYEIPLLPVAYIDADNEQDAKEKLLSISSQFGAWDLSELDEWLENIDNDIKEQFRFLEKEINIKIEDEPEKKQTNYDSVKQIAQKNDIWKIGDNIILYCEDSTNKEHDYDLLIYDPMFDDKYIYEQLPKYEENNKMLLFYDLLRCGNAIYNAVHKKWPFNYELILDGCTSWYVANRPLERHKSCAIFGNNKWNFEKAIYNDGEKREEQIATNSKGKYLYKPLDSGKHLSSIERYSNAGNEKKYQYEKPLIWIRALINGLTDIKQIYDPFAGSFTAGIIAIENNCEYVGYEINPEVFNIGLIKIYEETGIEPIRIDGKRYTELL